MKKRLAVLLCALMVMSLAACKQQETVKSSSGQGTAAAGVSSESSSAPGESSGTQVSSKAASSKKAESSKQAKSSSKTASVKKAKSSSKKTDGASSGKASSAEEKREIELKRGSPEWVLKKALEAVKAGDNKTLSECIRVVSPAYVDPDYEDEVFVDLGKEFPEVNKLINDLCFAQMEYHFYTDATIDKYGNSAVVPVTIKNRNMMDAIGPASIKTQALFQREQAKPEDQRMGRIQLITESNAILIEHLQDHQKAPLRAVVHKVEFTKSGGEWLIDDGSKFTQMLFNNFVCNDYVY